MKPQRMRMGFPAVDCPLRWLVLGFAVSLAVRVAVVFLLGGAAHGMETAHHEHESIARNLATGRGFRFNFFGPLDAPVLTSQQAPLVPAVLAGCYLAFGVETRAALLAMLLIQAVLSAATVVGLMLLANWLCAARWAPLATGCLAAVYPPLAASCVHVQAVVWNLFWLTLLLLGTEALRRGRRAAGPCAFVTAGVGSLLTDPILGGVIGLLLLLVALEQSRGLAIGLSVAVVVGISPWIYRNYQVHGRFVPIKDSFFYVFWQGNNAVSQGTDKLLVADADAEQLAATYNPLRGNQVALAARRRAVSVNCCLSDAFIVELQRLPSEIERMDRFRALAVQDLAQQPGHYLALCGRRLYSWIWFDPTNPRSYLWVYRLGYALLVLLALPGLWLLGPIRRWLPLVLAATALTAVHVLVITSARFRLPLELLLLLPAGLVGATAAERAAFVARGALTEIRRFRFPGIRPNLLEESGQSM